MELETLYRPVGQTELDLIEEMGFRGFPPRLPEQPYFYPVANRDYAVQIARDWNTKDEASQFTGYVLKFQVPVELLSRYPLRTVGASLHQEYWVPAGELEEFNRAIVGTIDVVGFYQGRPKTTQSTLEPREDSEL
jgi:hypothetical protein